MLSSNLTVWYSKWKAPLCTVTGYGMAYQQIAILLLVLVKTFLFSVAFDFDKGMAYFPTDGAAEVWI